MVSNLLGGYGLDKYKNLGKDYSNEPKGAPGVRGGARGHQEKPGEGLY